MPALERFVLSDIREQLTLLALARTAILRLLETEQLWDAVEQHMEGLDREFALGEHRRVIGEIEGGFPYLNRLGVLWQWALLEALVEDQAVEDLMAHPALASRPPIRDIRPKPERLAPLGDEERVRLLIQTAQLRDRRARGAGIDGVAQLLFVAGLAGLTVGLDDETAASLRELWAIRNAIVHRRGIADRRLVDQCPQLQLSPGDPIVVNWPRLLGYAIAANTFSAAMTRAIEERDAPSKDTDLG